jgi:penicillin-binding protein 2
MFERRLKIFLIMLIAMTCVLTMRAFQLQVLGRAQWRDRAADLMKRSQMIETTRGRILDIKGRPIAVDRPCIDACVDYRAIVQSPDLHWLKRVARRRLAARGLGREMLDQEIEQVRADLKIMWAQFAKLSNLTPEQIDEIRQSIVRKVEMRRRYVWFHRYEQARRGQENKDPGPWYRRWLLDDSGDAPEMDQFDVEVAEQTDSHVILRAITADISNELGKNTDRWPWLELRPSTHRVYPYGPSACHILGNLSRVNREDLAGDPNLGKDELRQYFPNDLIGRTGLEAMLEPSLRGTRGRLERIVGEDRRTLKAIDPIPGKDLRTTIDVDLQADIEELFKEVKLEGPRENRWADVIAMPGAAVVIDVPTGEVRAMVSHPGFDLNEFDSQYERMSRSDLERPLMNRATQFQFAPGSTVKPIVGIGAITQGLLGVDETIECKGFLEIAGKRYKDGRCWVASNFFEILGGNVAHHPIPWDAPHPTGFLDFRDALERSCNVYFETVADRLKIEGLAHWYHEFGLGRPTGIGIAEVSGQVPGDAPIPAGTRRAATWFSGIGQDQVLATPLQMANVAATLARDGIWKRPTLVPAGTATVRRADPGPDETHLKLSEPALRAARDGMVRVVNTRAGTGSQARHELIVVAGKTGSAQTSALRYPQRDELGRIIRDARGRVNWIRVEPIGTHAQPNPVAPWYRGTPTKEDRIAHAWFVGFAPADNPKLAFAVMIEYGGSGGAAAGALGKRLLDACVAHGYLAPAPRVTNAN